MTDGNEALDPAVLRGRLGRTQDRWADATVMVEALLADGRRPYVAWSGGKDSTVCAHVATRVDPTIPVVIYHSGLEYPETDRYIVEMSARYGWRLHVEQCVPDALDWLVRSGTWDHEATADPTLDMTYFEAMILRPSARALEQLGCDTVIWGLHCDESPARRLMLTSTSGVHHHSDGHWQAAPLWRWHTDDVWAYMATHGIAANGVYDRLRAMGAPDRALRVGQLVAVGALGSGRFGWLRRGWPGLYRQLVAELPRLAELA